MQCVAVCCSVLLSPVTCRIHHALQRVAACCSVFQCITVLCSALRCVAMCCNVSYSCVALCFNVFHCVAVRCPHTYDSLAYMTHFIRDTPAKSFFSRSLFTCCFPGLFSCGLSLHKYTSLRPLFAHVYISCLFAHVHLSFKTHQQQMGVSTRGSSGEKLKGWPKLVEGQRNSPAATWVLALAGHREGGWGGRQCEC